MVDDIEIRVVRGSRDLEQLSRDLKRVGGTELRKALLRGIRTAAKPMISQVRTSARSRLPKRGGLAADIAKSKLAIRTRATGPKTGVRISAQGRLSLHSIDLGTVRHPVFGNRKVWASQRVEAGFFTEPLEHDRPEVQRQINQVMRDIAHQIEGN